jgi:hypothetical protein
MESKPALKSRDGLHVCFDGFILDKGPGIIISQHKIGEFRFVDSDGMKYECEVLSPSLKKWLADYRGANDDIGLVVNHPIPFDDELTIDLSEKRLALLVRSLDWELLSADAGTGVLASIKKEAGDIIYVDFACHVTVKRSRGMMIKTKALDEKESSLVQNEQTDASHRPKEEQNTPLYEVYHYGSRREKQKWCVGGVGEEAQPSEHSLTSSTYNMPEV